MLCDILKPVKQELQLIQELINNQFTIKAGYLGAFAHLELSSADRDIRPALVVLSSRIFGYDPKKTIVLAGIFQFIYLAAKVQQGVSEIDSDYIREDTDPRDGSQFPVLIGDYLYSKFFYFTSDADITCILDPLAEIICQIHEGNILRKTRNIKTLPGQGMIELVEKETAPLFAGCCYLTARLGGAAEREQDSLMRYGHNLGMAYGLLEQGIAADFAFPYLKEALSNLNMFPDRQEKNILEKLVYFLQQSGHCLPAQHMVI